MAPATRRGPNTTPNNTNPNNMTPESVQAMIDQALLRNSTNGDGSHSSHGDNRRNVQTARPCFYADFMKCQPLNFKGNEGVVGLTRWIEKMESVFNISGCAIENQGISKVGYGIRDTWVDPVLEIPEVAPMTVGEVNTRVTKLVELHERDTHDFYALLEDAQDGRTRISQQVAMNSM
ncbi:hypothetical protein Tco_0837946 [Tanacetum coccineum]